jgi:hypothetical protein
VKLRKTEWRLFWTISEGKVYVLHAREGCFSLNYSELQSYFKDASNLTVVNLIPFLILVSSEQRFLLTRNRTMVIKRLLKTMIAKQTTKQTMKELVLPLWYLVNFLQLRFLVKIQIKLPRLWTRMEALCSLHFPFERIRQGMDL